MPPPSKEKHSPLFSNPAFKWKTDEVSNADLLSNTAITRAERIDGLPNPDLCTDISTEPFNPLIVGELFCIGDTFATGAVSLYAEGGISADEDPIGFY